MNNALTWLLVRSICLSSSWPIYLMIDVHSIKLWHIFSKHALQILRVFIHSYVEIHGLIPVNRSGHSYLPIILLLSIRKEIVVGQKVLLMISVHRRCQGFLTQATMKGAFLLTEVSRASLLLLALKVVELLRLVNGLVIILWVLEST